MNTAGELYEVNLVSSSKLKLRATARLAEGGEEPLFDACVLFHEAARFERRAVETLSPCPPATRLAGSIEECWCLLEGRDPDAAADVWSRILEESREVESATATSMLARLRPRYDQAIREFSRVVRACPTLLRGARSPVPASVGERASALHEVRVALKDFPGVPMLWGTAYRLEEASGDLKHAWEGLRRALALAPEHPQFRALSLLTATEALPTAKADEYLGEVYPTLHKAGAEICLMYAFAEIELARKGSGRPDRWRRALEAVNAAFPRARSEGLRKNLTAVRQFLEDMLAKRKADPDLLYKAGLGRLAVSSGGSVIDVLRADATARVEAMDASEVAA